MRNGESVSGSCRPKRTESPLKPSVSGDSVRLANCAAQAVRLFVFWEDGTKLHGCGWRWCAMKANDVEMAQLFLRAERMRMCAISSCERTRKILRRHVERGEVVRPARGMYARAAYWSGLSKPEKMLHVMRTAQSIPIGFSVTNQLPLRSVCRYRTRGWAQSTLRRPDRTAMRIRRPFGGTLSPKTNPSLCRDSV